MKIGEVHDALHAGKLVRRPGWPAGEFLFLVPGSTFTVNRAPLAGIFPEGMKIHYRPHFDRYHLGGVVGVYSFQHTDFVASDWEYFTPAVIEIAATTVAAPAATPAVEAPIAAVAPTPAPAASTAAHVEPAKPHFNMVWLIEIAPVGQVFVPEYWSASLTKFVSSPDSPDVTSYASMKDAMTAAAALVQKVRVIHHARQA